MKNYFFQTFKTTANHFVTFLFLTWLLMANAQAQITSVNKWLVEPPTVSAGMPATYSGVSVASPATNYHPYAYVVQLKGAGAGPWAITDPLPPYFVMTGCHYFIDSSATSYPCTSQTGGTASTGLVTTPVPSSVLTMVVDGQFTIDSTNTTQINTAQTQIGTGTQNSNTVSTPINYSGLNYNLELIKTAVATSAFGAPITYTLAIKNTSTAPVNFGNWVNIFDRLTNVSSISMTVLIGGFNCTTTLGSSCVTGIPSMGSTTIGANQGYDVFSASGLTGGMLLANGIMTISYTVTPTTTASCTPTIPTLSNQGYLNLTGVGNNFPDIVGTDNQSTVATSITGMIADPTCIPEGVGPNYTYPASPLVVTKTATVVPSTTYDVNYTVTITNTSASPVTFKYGDSVHAQTPVTTSFDVTYLSGSVSAGGSSFTGVSPAGVGSSPQTIMAGNAAQTLAAGATDTYAYTVHYKDYCHQRADDLRIDNNFTASIASYFDVSSNTWVYTGNAVGTATVVIPTTANNNCSVTTGKTVTPSGYSAPITFGNSMGTYTVTWSNPSSQTLFAAKVVDTLTVSDALYGVVPVDYSGLSCTAGGGAVTFNPPAPSGTVSPTYATRLTQGTPLINLQGVTFAPGSTLSCTYTLTAKTPTDATHCQSAGAPKLINFLYSDPDPAFNQNFNPLFPSSYANYTAHDMTTADSATVIPKLLPLCLDFSVNKDADRTVVLPGDPVNWTISAYNNAPLGGGPVPLNGGASMFTLTDLINPALGAISSHVCSPITSGTINACTQGLATSFGTPLTEIVTGVLPHTTVTETFQTIVPINAPLGSITNKVQFTPSAGTYIKGGGAVIESGKTVVIAWPTLGKVFSPAAITSGQPVNLIFTVTNLGYTPAVNGLGFTDTLNGLVVAGAIASNTCGGTAPVATVGSNVISWTGGALALGQASCTFTVPVTQSNYAQCPATLRNVGSSTVASASNITNVTQLDASGVNAQLSVECGKNISLLKVCKVAGDGVAIGAPFTFDAGGNTVTVPAGPAPKGYCQVVVSQGFPTGVPVIVKENINNNVFTVTAISATPAASQTSVDLAQATIGVTLGAGVSEVTFTNKRTKGFIEICKKVSGLPYGSYTFTVNGAGSYTVPANACLPPIEVDAGVVSITETSVGPFVISACDTFPAAQCTVNSNQHSVDVNVVGGDVSTQTVVNITNSPCDNKNKNCNKVEGLLKICKAASPRSGVMAGTPFAFTVSTPVGSGTIPITVKAGSCMPVAKLRIGLPITVTENNANNAYTATAIAVEPAANQTSIDLPRATTSVIVGVGVTEVTFSNKRNQGFIEICKSVRGSLSQTGSYTFTVNGSNPVTVPVNACSRPIAVNAGTATIQETTAGHFYISGCQTFPDAMCVINGVKAVTVDVAGGDISTQTVVNIVNSPISPPCTNCEANDSTTVLSRARAKKLK